MGSWVHTSLSFTAIALLHLLVLVSGRKPTGARRSRSSETSTGTCDFFNGRWVLDEEEYPHYHPSTCPFIEREFSCEKNGRADQDYTKYRWQPHDCNLQRFDGKAFLEKFRGKSFMFVGDSLSRNQWQSLTCLLHSAVPTAEYNVTRVGDVSNFEFTDSGVKVMLDRNVYLVDTVREQIGRVLKLESIEGGKLWKGIDTLIFNTWHWWNRRGPSQPWDFIEVGGKIIKDMDRMLAFEKALTTWGQWVDTNVDPAKTRVFFQGISPSHYNGTDWGEPRARTCEGQKEPLLGSTYPGGLPPAVGVLKNTLRKITKPVTLLDITNLSLLRKDGHPSIYGLGGRTGMDCSHWCLCGVPDTWNEILYNFLRI
ncbi:hypothetical protein ACLB2K_025723 [Fragaria x ananassa]